MLLGAALPGWAVAQAQTAAAAEEASVRRPGLPSTTDGTPAFLLTPSVSVSETVTNNIGGSGIKGPSDAVTTGSVGFQLRNRTGQTLASVDYALSGLFYAKNSDRNTHQQTLTSRLDFQWAERRGFLHAEAGISQGAISAFGAQPTGDSLPSSNVTEVRTLRLAPRWESQLGESLKLGAGAEVAATSAQNALAGDTTTYSAQLQISPFRRGPLGWAAQVAHQSTKFGTGRRSESTRLVAIASRELDELDLRLSANLGYERGTLVSSDSQSSANWGVGLDWTPSPRTSAEFKYDKRLFGYSHLVALSYRTPLTVWRLTSQRSLNQSGTDAVVGVVGTVFDLFFAQLASVEPDPVRRAALVSAFLAQQGLSANTPVTAGFLRSASTIDNLLQLSGAWRGLRSTAIVTVSRNRSRRAEALVSVSDDLSNSSTVTTSSWSFLFTHRLTPELSASASATFQSGDGDQASQSNRQRVFSAQVGGPVGPKSNWSFVLRRALYEASLVTSGESTAIASYTVRF